MLIASSSGLQTLDIVIVIVVLLAIVLLGLAMSRSVRNESEFYLGGRKLGRFLQFFLTFGNMNDSNGAPVIATEVYREGISGMWIGFQTLFITPFYWFSVVWFRRIRLITMGDLFVERFGSRSLAVCYAAFNIGIAVLLMGLGHVVSYKVASAMMPKAPADYSAADKQSVREFAELQYLHQRYAKGELGDSAKERMHLLEAGVQRGDVCSSVSCLSPIPFYTGYAVIIAIYITLGGLKAAAIVDAFQGLLILAFSIILIPAGLAQVGGFAGLHEKVPASMFQLFGSVASSEYTWYSIAAIAFTSLLQIFGLQGNMAGAGGARNESVARVGVIGGAVAKRLVLIMWAFCALIAVALFPAGLSDPDNVWGALSLRILSSGLLGLMLAGMLAGHMPAVGNAALTVSGLFTRNFYEIILPGKSEHHYFRVGQVTVVVVLMLGIPVAIFSNGVISMISLLITFNAFFGAAVLLIFFWRRLTERAVMISAIIWTLVIGIIPSVLPMVPAFRQDPALTVSTQERVTFVAAGSGNKTPVKHVIEPKPVYFERVESVSRNGALRLEGGGRFLIETYILSLAGIPVQSFSPAALLATRWLFDGIFPFAMLIGLSFVTKPAEKSRLDRFYVRLRTPVAPTPEEDEVELHASLTRPARLDHLRLFPGSQWEFNKWEKGDLSGFASCWLIVLGVIGILVWFMGIGA